MGTTGAAGSLGEAGTTGAAGASGEAGTTGTAGTDGAAGATGAAGSGGAEDVCQRLQAEYADALDEAKTCDVHLRSHVCTQLVQTSLTCPVCKSWVDDRKELDEIRADWKRARCDKRKIDCSFTSCVNLGPGICIPSGRGDHEGKDDDEGKCGERRR